MGKLMIKNQGSQVGEVNLRLGEMTIGRSTSCDIVLKNDLNVSARHAKISTVGRQSTIEDLDSTNGTFIESRRIQRHELRHGDIIIIGKHELRYRDIVEMNAPPFGGRSTDSSSSITSQEKTRIITAHAQLVALDGKNKGKNIPLMREETVLENPGKNPARIYRTVHGYVLHAQVGPGEPRLNDRPVQPGGQLLENGDILEVAGTRYQVNV